MIEQESNLNETASSVEYGAPLASGDACQAGEVKPLADAEAMTEE